MRVLSFNLYFDAFCMKERMKSIGNIIQQTKPIVIGFQEVTMKSLQMLQTQKWFSKYSNSWSEVNPKSTAYFVALFSVFPIVKVDTLDFKNSNMGRELVAFEIQISNGKTMIFGNSHFESMPESKNERLAQLEDSLEYIEKWIKRSSSAVGGLMMGDTNLFQGELNDVPYKMELAKSNRSKCRHCMKKIEKSSVRIAERVEKIIPNKKTPVLSDEWYHVDCFFEGKQCKVPLTWIPGYTALPLSEQVCYVNVKMDIA